MVRGSPVEDISAAQSVGLAVILFGAAGWSGIAGVRSTSGGRGSCAHCGVAVRWTSATGVVPAITSRASTTSGVRELQRSNADYESNLSDGERSL